ncbi:interleukin-12 subunit beta [Pholidichthys leucotaenia]
MRTLSLWIFGLLISLTGAHGLSSFPDDFVVVKIDTEEPVSLKCGSATTESVTWKHNGVELKGKNDQILTLEDVDTQHLGNYSCWKGGKQVSLIAVLLEAYEEEEFDSLLKCWAKSYDCNFSCTWTSSDYDTVRLGLGRDCQEGSKSCQWVNNSTGFQFELSHNRSPYAEESTMIELTAEATKDLEILRRTKSFYLRDIVKPDSPQIVKCQVEKHQLNVTIDPPSSWSTPHSFFSLHHQIEYELKDDGTRQYSENGLIPKKINKLRARSRDPLVLSEWSEWTPWKNVTKAKKPRDKNRDKLHCLLHGSTPNEEEV